MNDVKSTQQERFKYMREEIINLSQQKLADTLNIKQQSIADIESGRKQKIDTEILYKLLNEFSINTEWLLFGTGNPTKIDDNEEVSKAIPDNLVSIPFYSAKVAAGIGETLPDYPEKDVLHFDKRWIENILGINTQKAVIFQAVGDSMDGGDNPIKNGDLLLIDTSIQEVINGKTFVLELNNSDLVVKRVLKDWNGDVTLISNNPKYENRKLNSFETAKIIGRVVWNGSKETV